MVIGRVRILVFPRLEQNQVFFKGLVAKHDFSDILELFYLYHYFEGIVKIGSAMH
jgi:hypothetical protein